MRKLPLIIALLTCLLRATAQDKTVAQLKKELEDHPQQDAVRADKLNDLSFNYFFLWNERKSLWKKRFLSRKK
jgi:hypothetical protein